MSVCNDDNDDQDKFAIKKLNPIEHMLKRPDMYIGSTDVICEEHWILNPSSINLKVKIEDGDDQPKAKIQKLHNFNNLNDSFTASNSNSSIHTNPEDVADDKNIMDRSSTRIELKSISYIPALCQIFEEIIMNAADNKQRDPKMSYIHVEIQPHEGYFSVQNDGQGIPVRFCEENKLYEPELAIAEMFTSSNYRDDLVLKTAGKNGVGLKGVVTFSMKTIFETQDSIRRLKFKQIWTQNRQHRTKADIKELKPFPKKMVNQSMCEDINKDSNADINKIDSLIRQQVKDYTKVTVYPDFRRFGEMNSFLDNDSWKLMERRVYDLAALLDVKIKLNGKKINMRSLKDYAALFIPNLKVNKRRKQDEGDVIEKGPQYSEPVKSSEQDATDCLNSSSLCFFYKKLNDQCEFVLSQSTDQIHQHISYVNQIFTSNGGSHVNYIIDQIIFFLIEQIKLKHKCVIKPYDLKSQIFLILNLNLSRDHCIFESQSKKELKCQRLCLQSICKLEESILKQIYKQFDPLISKIVSDSNSKTLNRINSVSSKVKRLNIPKLEDANDAGGKYSDQCTLILTEGDSAKALAVSGLSVIGRDRYGVFPLKGTIVNVREFNFQKAIENEEIKNLIKIIGLKINKKYTDTKELRYGHIMIMTDQDHDGSHIKGLLVNLFSAWWNELLHINGFLQEFITPIVKVKSSKEEISFYTLPQFYQWKDQNNGGKGYSIKYYKGLGTSTSIEAKQYFSDLARHKLEFKWESNQCDESIELAFAKNKTQARKNWLAQLVPGTYLDHARDQLTYYNFVHKELILFSEADNIRSIPSIMDGLKPSLRKILYVCFMRNIVKEIKVAQLAGSVAEKSAYHHGEKSLTGAIIGMAQNFVGSNNINLLYPSGQFGSRSIGGKDSASPRYIFTYLTPICRSIFHVKDDPILNYLNDDGQSVEPEFYVPIIPMVLVNGSSGIGTGWSSSIPNYNPRDLVKWIQHHIYNRLNIANDYTSRKNENIIHTRLDVIENSFNFVPWYRGFNGIIKQCGNGRWIVYGRIEQVDSNTLEITELPLIWTSDYKNYLNVMLEKKQIHEIKEYHTDTKVCFRIRLTKDQMSKAMSEDIYKYFKCTQFIMTSNMVLFNTKGQLHRYNSVEEILLEYFDLRMEFYIKRKQYLTSKLKMECDVLENRVRYIGFVRDGTLKLNQSHQLLLQQLIQYKFMRHNVINVETEYDSTESSNALSDFYYLVNQTQLSLTAENMKRLENEYHCKLDQLKIITELHPEEMWVKRSK